MVGVVLIFNVVQPGTQLSGLRLSRTALTKFIVLAASAPLLWFAYNGIVYRNPLEFENGPYSAKAIERRTQTAGNPGHPGSRNLVLAGMYFLKSGEANVAENEWLQRAWVLFTLAALAGAALASRLRQPTEPASPLGDWLPLLFLVVPLPFYALSVAYGGVPIFVPAWWPFTHYNDRYGLQLLPAFAAAVAVLVYLAQSQGWNRKLRVVALSLLFAVVSVSYASVWYAGPVSLKEAQVNMRSRNELELQLATWLHKLPSDATLLMNVSDHVGALQHAGIPLKQVINEGNHRTWKQPVDTEGLWERALADPAQYADYAVASEGDVVWQAARARRLPALVVIHTTGQAPVIVYRAR
jgi:hypothetical protein